MSAYSTLRITRSKALGYFHAKTAAEPSNAFLEDFLNGHLEPRLLNAIIVSDDADNDDTELPTP